jgi:hypothetical protein
MSISTKVLSTLAIATLVATSFVSANAQTNGSLSAPLSNSSFTYCNWDNFMATSDVEAARNTTAISGKASFYTTENTSNNVINGKCVNNLVANYVPYISGHKTSFDLTNAGAVTNVKVMNTSPTVKSVECDGNDTVIRFTDAEQDKLEYSSIISSNDFDAPSSTTESNNVLKLTLKRKDSNFTGTNNATIYINEMIPGTLDAGYKSMPASSTAPVPAYNTFNATVDKAATTSKLAITLKGVCDSSIYTTSSSSSSMSSSSMSSSSSSMSSSSMMMAKSSEMTTVVVGGKGMLTRTGGSN